MKITKELKDISWQVSEEEYRADKALSYSTLSRYEKVGFEGLSTLFDKVESPSLTFGSCVDAIITGGMDEFNSRFIVADLPNLTESLTPIAIELFKTYNTRYNTLDEIPDSIIAEVGKNNNFYANDKYVNYRIKLIKEGCAEYYKTMYLAEDKTIISSFLYSKVLACVESLKTSDSTRKYFEDDNPFDDCKRYYQLKFKSTLNNINYRCMADLIYVDYKNKLIVPIDLKTSSHTEYDFYKSFVQWNYQIQSRLYWRIIRDNLDKDDYFKEFKLLDYKFIVVNKETLNPLVWECPFTNCKGTLTFGKTKQIEFRDPEDIGKELSNYLEHNPKVPNGIELTKTNDIAIWLNKM